MQFVFLPGLDGTGELFDPLVRLWPQEWPAPKIIPFPNTRIMSFAELQAFVEPQLPRDVPWVLAAESFGGPLAIKIAAGKSSGLQGLVLSATFIRRPRGRLGEWAHPFVHPALFRHAWFDPFLRLGMRLQKMPPAQIEWLISVRDKTPPDIFAARLKEALEINVFEELSHCPVPVLCFYAKKDLVLSPDQKDEMRRANPSATMVGFDTPHFLLQSCPAEALEEIKRFVKTL